MPSKPAARPNSAPARDTGSRAGAGEVCTGCKYDLRGLPPRGRCPECGTEFALSLTGLAPGSLPPTSRYQKFQYDAGLGRRALMKSLIWCIVGVGIVAAWKTADDAKGGSQEAVNYLIRYGVSASVAVGIYLLASAMSIVEFAGPVPRAVLGVAGALAGADLAHHITFSIGGWMLLGVPWFVAFVVFVGLITDLLDIDLIEAGVIAILTYGARVILKFALFDPMFA